MTTYPRTLDGFASALRSAHSIAAMHTDKEYVLYVDSRKPTEYAITLRGLFDPVYVENGTVANVVTPSGEMVKI